MKLRTGMAFALMLLLIAGSVVFGAYKGWSKEKAPVEETLAGLESMLQTRVESAYNVLAVAKRHVPQTDEAYKKVDEDRARLEKASSTLEEKAAANEDLARDAAALLEILKNTDSVQADARDKMYVESYLPQMLAQSEEKTVGAAYNQAAAEFNERINNSFSGWIARLLGVKPAQEFIVK
ncbi:MAG: LemA family protein [Clostridia bacterium]|nr:LemA family protein [Clostridia bacterium]